MAVGWSPFGEYGAVRSYAGIVAAGPNGRRQLSPSRKMKCCGYRNCDPDTTRSPCPRWSRPALARPRARSSTQQYSAEVTQICDRNAFRARGRSSTHQNRLVGCSDAGKRQTSGVLRKSYSIATAGSAQGHRGSRQSPGERTWPQRGRGTLPHPFRKRS